MMECYFTIDIYAPDGLESIEGTLRNCELPLYTWKSGYNEKVILRASPAEDLEWNMDPSNGDCMFISGYLIGAVETTERKFRSLSLCLTEAGFPHRILLDPHSTGCGVEIVHAWQSDFAR